MSAVAERIESRQETRRRWTMADLAALPDQLPTGPGVYELWQGELRLMAPPGEIHGSLTARLGGLLLVHGEWEGHGRAYGEVGVVIRRDPDTVFGADAAFLTSAQLPPRRSPEGYLLTPPALAVEVRSKNDDWPGIEEKVRHYLSAGVQAVWVADPRSRSVRIYRVGQEPEILGEDAALTAEGILPGLQFPVRRLFEGFEEAQEA